MVWRRLRVVLRTSTPRDPVRLSSDAEDGFVSLRLSALAYLGVAVLHWRAEPVYDSGIAVGGGSWEVGARSGGPGLGVAFYRGPTELHGVQTWSFRTSADADRQVGRMVDQVRYRRTWGGADLERGSYRFALRPDGGIAELRERDVGLRSATISYWSIQRVPHEWVMAATALPPILWALRRVRRAAVRPHGRGGVCASIAGMT